ncbi:MAG: transposase [Candidatus Delongbacteria bacterium]|nr:transposase [Candidatus Delongbacteria bacterium]
MKDRKPNRLKSYDYNRRGYYYVTICTQDKAKSFGKIINEKMELSKIGNIANKIWFTIPEYHKNIKLDTFIIMPDHIHCIIILENSAIKTNRSKMILSKTIHAFKSAITRDIRENLNNNYFAWEKSFYDHIIRDDMILNRIRKYILDNPSNWND